MAGRYNSEGLFAALQLRLTVGRQVRLVRQQRGWSQEVLAELAGLNRSYVGAIERGEYNVGIDNIERIALALEITISQLVGCTDPELPVHPLNRRHYE